MMDLAVLGQWLDFMILGVSSNLNDSVILSLHDYVCLWKIYREAFSTLIP